MVPEDNRREGPRTQAESAIAHALAEIEHEAARIRHSAADQREQAEIRSLQTAAEWGKQVEAHNNEVQAYRREVEVRAREAQADSRGQVDAWRKEVEAYKRQLSTDADKQKGAARRRTKQVEARFKQETAPEQSDARSIQVADGPNPPMTATKPPAGVSPAAGDLAKSPALEESAPAQSPVVLRTDCGHDRGLGGASALAGPFVSNVQFGVAPAQQNLAHGVMFND